MFLTILYMLTLSWVLETSWNLRLQHGDFSFKSGLCYGQSRAYLAMKILIVFTRIEHNDLVDSRYAIAAQ